MTEDNKNIITIDLDLNTLISSSKRTDALQNTISEKLKSNSFVNNIAADLVRDHIKDSVLQGFSDEVEKMIKATYGTKEAIQKMVDSNSHNVRMQILEIMKNKTEILEKSIMKAMLSDGFQENIAKQVETLIKDRVIKSITHVDYPDDDDDDY